MPSLPILDPMPPEIPRQVLLFSGHRVDAPGRPSPRFTAHMVPAAQQRLGEVLDQLQAGPLDLALCQAAAGGDLLFLEACHSRGVRCEIMLPFDEPTFIRESILASVDGEQWMQRWMVLKSEMADAPRIMPNELGPLPQGADAYERCNLWLLETALIHGPDKLRFLCLWNGLDGDGPGGVRHMMTEARRRAAIVCWIDTRTL